MPGVVVDCANPPRPRPRSLSRRERAGARAGRRHRIRLALAALVVGLAPRLAEAHALTGGGGWTDELVCLVPTAIMLVLVFVLSRPSKYGNAERKDEKK